MRRTAIVLALCGLGTVANATPAEPWDGPFSDPEAMTGANLSSWSSDLTDHELGPPPGVGADTLAIVERVTTAPDEPRFWHLALHTKTGWFLSPVLGRAENRDTCDLEAVGAVGDRLTFRYTCSVGRFTWAEKSFALLCKIDRAGRPACGSAVTASRNNVHTGGKEDGTDVLHDTSSCTPTFTANTIVLARRAPSHEPGDSTTHVATLSPCHSPGSFVLTGDFAAASHGKPPLFDEAGNWR